MKKKLYVTREVTPAVVERFRRDYDALEGTDDDANDAAMLIDRAQGMDGLFIMATDLFNADVIASLPGSVKIISTLSVGADHIDLDAARAAGLIVTNTPDCLTEATAEIAFLCMLGAARRGFEGQAAVRDGTWRGFRPTFMLGVDLWGKRLGIVGMGRIGQAVARRAAAFGMEVHYHNRRRLETALEVGAIYHETLDTLLPESQFLSLNCPATAENRHMLNADTLGKLPDAAVIVNTARGGLINDEDLIAALRSGKVFAAGLDVFDGEPEINPGYLDLPNVFMLPHLGSATIETRTKMGMMCLEALDAFFAGHEAPYRVV